MARDFLQELAVRAGTCVGVGNGPQPVEIELCIGHALIGDQPPNAFDRDRLRQRRQRVADFVFEQFGRNRGIFLLLGEFCGLHFRPRGLQPGAEAAQITVD